MYAAKRSGKNRCVLASVPTASLTATPTVVELRTDGPPERADLQPGAR